MDRNWKRMPRPISYFSSALVTTRPRYGTKWIWGAAAAWSTASGAPGVTAAPPAGATLAGGCTPAGAEPFGCAPARAAISRTARLAWMNERAEGLARRAHRDGTRLP